MEGPTTAGGAQPQTQQPQDAAQQQAQAQSRPVERLNPAVLQQINIESVKTRAISLFNTITRILEDFDLISRSNAVPKWQDVLGQFSMVNLELFNIVDDIKKVSKNFVVHPRNVNAENATILPVMLSSKLLPEMEVDDNSKREQLLLGMQNLPVMSQIDKLKARIDMIAAACASAEKVIADTRKAYGLDTRQRMITVPTLDKAFSAKIQEQENLLRAAVNQGEGLRLPVDQRHPTSPLPSHLVDVLTVNDVVQTHNDGSGMYSKNTPPMSSGNISNQGTQMQASGGQLMGRSVPSPSTATATSSFENTTSPLPYANSPRSNVMNAPSPQQQTIQQQQQQQHQLQQRQKLLQQLPSQQQQLLAQQLRQGLGQNQLSQLHDLQTQAAQKFQSLHGQNTMQLPQTLGSQQFQSRQLPTGHMMHGIGQSQLGQGNQLNRHLGQFSASANSALFNAAQSTPNAPMMSNMSATMASQSLLPRMQYALGGGNPQRAHSPQMLGDQTFNMGANPASMMTLPQQQQQVQQGAFGGMQQNSQNLQSTMVPLQNTAQNLQNFQQQRQQNQQ